MTSHLFGGSWRSSSSGYALHRSAQHNSCDPSVSAAINKSFYVDDFLQSVDDINHGVHLVGSVKERLLSDGFHLTKFVANDQTLLKYVPVDDKCIHDTIVQLSDSKTLGIMWNIDSDCFYFDVNIVKKNVLTKRCILSFVASIFDPLGLVSPIVLMGKVIFQETTLMKLSWDEPVPDALVVRWHKWLDTLLLLSDIRIPRCIKPKLFNDGNLELHSFSDASEHSYGCCIFIRCVGVCGVHSSLIYAKHRLAPTKPTTIPRLELQAAVLSAKVSSVVRKELEVSVSRVVFWVDSMIVLSYIRNSTRRFKPFVANRLGLIHELTAVEDWHHVSGVDNPADIVSRGSSPDVLDKKMWLQGPSFLRQYKSDWSVVESPITPLNPDDHELKKQVIVHTCEGNVSHPIDVLCDYYSSWYKLKKALAWMLRIKCKLLHRSTSTDFLTVEEIRNAEHVVLRYVQSVHYSAELSSLSSSGSVTRSSPLYKLQPVLNDDDLLVINGRLSHAPFADDRRDPVVVPHIHPIASLIVADIHGSSHLGQEWVVSLVRKNYWIVSLRKIVKAVSRKCVTCRKRFAVPGCQQMADLPRSRLNPHHPPFFDIGLDCFGPYLVKYGRAQIKRYGCIFTCFTTRAVHLEKINTLDTDSLINALRRFISRRGCPSSIYCDNGTNLTGSCRELKLALRSLSQSDENAFCLVKSITWKFAPPLSSHMGGVYERMIRTVRKVFAGMFNPTVRLTDEILETLFCEVEGIINGRPITKVSMDVNDSAALTPNHLLLLKGDIQVTPGVFSFGDMYRKRWRFVQGLVNAFWKRWLSYYLPDLQKRVKWNEKIRNLLVGDLVLICDVASPRGMWPLGLVKEVHVGRDGLVRSVRVKTVSTELVRPVTKLVLLEGYDEY